MISKEPRAVRQNRSEQVYRLSSRAYARAWRDTDQPFYPFSRVPIINLQTTLGCKPRPLGTASFSPFSPTQPQRIV
jgi:hypothetical protein